MLICQLTMRSTEIIAQAPIQSRPDTLSKNERLFPLLIAEALNRIREYHDGKSRIRLDAWNTVGSKIDTLYASQPRNVSRYEYNGRQIEQRYQKLHDLYGIDQTNRTILRDDDPKYEEVVLEIIRENLSNNRLQVSKETFIECSKCDKMIAPIEAIITRCPNCKGNELRQSVRTGMFINFTNDLRHGALQVSIGENIARSRFKSDVLNLPNRILISKQRDYGMSLTEFGVDDGLVLDPKIPLALFEVVSKKSGLGTIEYIVQGIDSLGNTIPFSCVLSGKPETKYITTGMIPKYSDDDINRKSQGFYYPFLPLYMISRAGDLDSKSLEAVYREFDRTKRKYFSCTEYLKNNANDNEVLHPDKEFDSIIISLLDINSRSAILQMREYVFDYLSRLYVERCKREKLKPDSDFLIDLNNLFELIYGKK